MMLNQSRPKIGLLPMYIELYDRMVPEIRPRIESFYQTVGNEMLKRGVEVIAPAICRTKPEFTAALKSFEEAKVDAVVTLHLAYSPSLESATVLAATKLPIIVLDTTPGFNYGPLQDAEELMYNHGIHGVQDMCNLLIRNGKPFQIEAGHWEKSNVLDRVTGWVRAAFLANRIKNIRVGRIGETFAGMGDFAVPAEILRSTIGVETITCNLKEIKALLSKVTEEELNQELETDSNKFKTDEVNLEEYHQTLRICLAVRKWIERENLTAFTLNFLNFNQKSGLLIVPFLEASKAMARGLGYAGEGDVLTAALVGTLASIYPEVTFTEMFCPDWGENSIFLSHMGEMNINLAAEQPRLFKIPFPYTDAKDPVIAVGRFREGKAVLISLAPSIKNTYSLIITPIMVKNVTGKNNMEDKIHGWFSPGMPISEFLAGYSRVGGTHHLAMVYGDVTEDIVKFGTIMGWNVVTLI